MPPIFCRTCGAECLQNDKTIKGHTIVWCQECEQQWLKGDDQKVSSKLPEGEAKLALERRSQQLDSWGDQWKNMNNPDFWTDENDS